MVKRKILALVISFMLIGCAAGTPDLIPSYKYGDEKLDCEKIKAEIEEIKLMVEQKVKEAKKLRAGNAVLASAAVILMPILMVGVDDGSKQDAEINACKCRAEALVLIAKDKGCPNPFENLIEYFAKIDEELHIKVKISSGISEK
jgi:hypothetical protein